MGNDSFDDIRDRTVHQDSSKEPVVPEGWDRRAFLMRSALATSIAALTGNPIPAGAQTPPPAPAGKPNGTTLSPDLPLFKLSKGPVMTVVEEMYTSHQPAPALEHGLPRHLHQNPALTYLEQVAGRHRRTAIGNAPTVELQQRLLDQHAVGHHERRRQQRCLHLLALTGGAMMQ